MFAKVEIFSVIIFRCNKKCLSLTTDSLQMSETAHDKTG